MTLMAERRPIPTAGLGQPAQQSEQNVEMLRQERVKVAKSLLVEVGLKEPGTAAGCDWRRLARTYRTASQLCSPAGDLVSKRR